MNLHSWWQRNICRQQTAEEERKDNFDYQKSLIASATIKAKDETDCKRVDAMIAMFYIGFEDMNTIHKDVADMVARLNQKREQIKPRDFEPRYINMYNPDHLYE